MLFKAGRERAYDVVKIENRSQKLDGFGVVKELST